MTIRRRKPRFEPTKVLAAWWDEREQDFMFHHPTSKSDGHYLCGVLCNPRWERTLTGPIQDPSFVEELEARGFDTTTLRFTVERRDPATYLKVTDPCTKRYSMSGAVVFTHERDPARPHTCRHCHHRLKETP